MTQTPPSPARIAAFMPASMRADLALFVGDAPVLDRDLPAWDLRLTDVRYGSFVLVVPVRNRPSWVLSDLGRAVRDAMAHAPEPRS